MKKIFHLSATLLAAALLLASCGGKTATPSKDTISGPLGQYFKVVDRNYKINDGRINIEIERTAAGLPSPWKEGMEVGYQDGQVQPGFTAEFLDAEGDVICSDKTDIVFEKDALKATVALAVGESTSIPFIVTGKKVAAFRVSSTFEYHEPEQSTSVSSASSVKSIYDAAVDEYSKILKEAEDEYSEMTKEAAEEMKSAMNEAIDDIW